MKRFYIEVISEDSEYVTITGSEFRHLSAVLRLKEGARVGVFNGLGVELKGRVESIGKTSARMKVTGSGAVRAESPVGIVLLQALVKGDGPEFIVRKATELGVKEVVFYSTGRTVPVLDKGRAAKGVARLKRVSIGAAKQSGRSILPRISVTDFQSAVDSSGWSGGALKLFLYERLDAKREGIKGVLRSFGQGGGVGAGAAGAAVVVLVGPEGGFTEEEATLALTKGFRPVSLGPRTLRSETAAVAALSVIQYELGDMDV